MSESSAQINGGKGVTGIVLKPEPVNEEEITVGFQSPDKPSKIISDQTHLSEFYKVITLSKEAFQKSRNSNNTVTFDAFAVIIKFQNMSKDEKNSTLLVNEVIAITMGVAITNLTDKISIHYKNVKFEGNPVCSSWNGTGSRPVWTDDGCETKIDGDNITCLISHLTYFAILLTPVNETISDSDLKNLTIITRVGCSLSMIFLAVILFMHFLLRRTKANTSTKLLMHRVSSMFRLNLCFLVNDLVASLKNSVACQIMGAAMHYFLLATFTWFAVHAFHLCLHVYTQGIDQISRYLLKVSIPSWGIPSVVVIVLLATGKYGEQVISADVGAQTVTMCWLTNNDVHLIVNVGYYSLVFLFTFTTFIIILTWVVCIRKTKTEHSQVNRSGVDIVTIMGLCCMMGITWGFAFFAYGAARMVFYYVFTVLNSFQGFFLFIYYYKNSKRRPTEQPESSSNTTAVSYGLQVFENPYNNLPLKKLT
ncbi:adhesion G-protein coupled receptor G2-like [Cynoglossus semilaevis]|uniref:adhesion G-protein coupled receptor G2-like n=1 Tax=Cynoglossus semilaevis TaxID=244447 RepID=UPI000D6257EB|nr:adhesion G-protein coupled receptor G2-like [Cynoglossus semilaevis]